MARQKKGGESFTAVWATVMEEHALTRDHVRYWTLPLCNSGSRLGNMTFVLLKLSTLLLLEQALTGVLLGHDTNSVDLEMKNVRRYGQMHTSFYLELRKRRPFEVQISLCLNASGIYHRDNLSFG